MGFQISDIYQIMKKIYCHLGLICILCFMTCCRKGPAVHELNGRQVIVAADEISAVMTATYGYRVILVKSVSGEEFEIGTSDFDHSQEADGRFRIDGPWFSFWTEDYGKTTYFTFDPNVTKEERSFRVELMDGPAMGNYYVIQRAY